MHPCLNGSFDVFFCFFCVWGAAFFGSLGGGGWVFDIGFVVVVVGGGNR